MNPSQPTAVTWPLSERPLLPLPCRHLAGRASLLRAQQSRKPKLQSSCQQHHSSHGVNEGSGLLSCLRRERQRQKDWHMAFHELIQCVHRNSTARATTRTFFFFFFLLEIILLPVDFSQWCPCMGNFSYGYICRRHLGKQQVFWRCLCWKQNF